ncbi:MAG: helix-turn-helix transcriptional regulator [Bacteroidota bacterium]
MKKEQLPEVYFENQENPQSFFDIVRIEDLAQRRLDHDIGTNHLVKFYIIFFVLEGEGSHTIDFVDHTYQKGTVLLIRKDQVHKFAVNPSVKGYLLVFTEEFIVSHLNRMEALRAMQLFNESLSFPKIDITTEKECTDFTILVKCLELEYQIKDTFSIGITRSVLHVVITKLFRIKAKQGRLVERKKYLSQFLAFQELVEKDCFKSKKVQYYALELGVSPKTLNNIVKQIINDSAKAFIDERAIMQIKRLLISSEHSIKEIAYLSGFSDPTNFFKYFKKLVGTSPDAFRQAN